MLDNQLFALLRQWLLVEAPKRGATIPRLQLRYQPTQQGRSNERTVYMHTISYRRVGQRTVAQKWDGTTLVRTETQSMETTMQFSITQPTELDDDALTHGDVLNIVAASLQGDDAIKWFKGYGMSVLRVTDVRHPWFNNDRDQNEATPSFDIVCKHNNVYVDGQPVVTNFNFEVVAVPNLA